MRRSPQHRRGFTLMEVMLVIGVIAIFGGMTFPSVLRMFGQQKLTESAERVRFAIASARNRAIDSGLVYQFCCEPGGSHYVVVPFEPDHTNSNSGGQTAKASLASRGAGQLPSGLTFRSAIMGIGGVATAASSTYRLAAVALDGLPNAGNFAGLNWSPPILFNPDGSAGVDAEITIGDARSQSVKLRIRAFTGAVSMERLTTERR